MGAGVEFILSAGLTFTAPSTQKLGRSSICCQRVTSLPVESIQVEGFPWCFPTQVHRRKILKNSRHLAVLDFDLLLSELKSWLSKKKCGIFGPLNKLEGKLYDALTVAEVEPSASDQVVLTQSVVIPDADLQTAVGQVCQADAFVGDSVLPFGIQSSTTHGRLLLA